MSDGPWIKFYPSDWLTGTRGMSAAETGVYITLIAMMYEKGAAIVLDSARLARLCGCPVPGFTKILDGLIAGKKITYANGGLFHERVQKELATRQLASVTASNSAKARWEKDKQNQHSDDAVAMPKPSSRSARQKSDTRIQNPEALELELQLTPSKTDRSKQEANPVGAVSAKPSPPSQATRLPENWLLPKGWGDWALAKFPAISAAFIREEAEKFRDFWVAKATGATKRDWEATWRTWMRRAVAETSRHRGPSGQPISAVERRKQELRERIQNEHGIGRESSSDPQDDGRFPILIETDRRSS